MVLVQHLRRKTFSRGSAATPVPLSIFLCEGHLICCDDRVVMSHLGHRALSNATAETTDAINYLQVRFIGSCADKNTLLTERI